MSAASFDLSGRLAVVTGASRGIGLGMAEALAAARFPAAATAALEALAVAATRRTS